MKKGKLSELNALFEALSSARKLYIPTEVGNGVSAFAEYREGMPLSKQLNTVRSAKDLFFPQVENLMGFQMTGKQIGVLETRDTVEDFIVFGVRACDLRSFDILDRVFLSHPKDTYYETRRSHATIIAMACSEPEETCFCTAFGIDPTDPKADVTCWMDTENLYWRCDTEKGKALTKTLSMLEDCDEKAVAAQREKTKEILKKLPLGKLSLDAFGAGKTQSLFDRPEWDSLSEACLGCGTCTFVCPTCQCYDIQEFDTGSEIRRFRCWDSCMYSDFTKMSAGQPRPTQKERFRQRFLHKLVYYPENNEGIFGCVGCGRCLKKCPIHMNIAKVMKTLGEESK